MTVLVIIACWILVVSVLAALCVAARRGDLQQHDPDAAVTAGPAETLRLRDWEPVEWLWLSAAAHAETPATRAAPARHVDAARLASAGRTAG